MNWTVVWICVGLAVAFKVWMVRKIRQWMHRDRLARLAGQAPAEIERLQALWDRLRAEKRPAAERWAALEAAAAPPEPGAGAPVSAASSRATART